ncbi:NADPH-dependent F420 reductase [Dyella subtropica]|uniref:NADPH-dependent F420 reductase n=1 Tax=Dyella subtropica TaxID=2992127 RepID=UPI00225BA1BC|nr:NADPH-dependent F420 reductase [Dyella subtropica]
MKIGIIGSGNMGGCLGKLWSSTGHQVMFSFTQDPKALDEAAASAGGRTGTAIDAAQFGDVVLVAVPWAAIDIALKDAAPALAGKILISCNNPLNADLSGLSLGTNTSAAEEVARLAPTAKVVEVLFPFAQQLQSGKLQSGGQRPTQFYCGDDVDAKRMVATLIGELGLDPVDAGPLTSARFLEPLGMLMVQLAYRQGMGVNISAQLLRH